MSPRTYVTAGLLLAIAACAASGPDPESGPNIDDPQPDAATPEAEARDGGPTFDFDAERPLVCGDAGFCETRLPRSDDGAPLSLRRVWAVAPNDVWSITTNGYVLHYDGTSWTIAYRAKHDLYAVWATATSVWVGGEAGLLFRRNAVGEWSRVEPNHLGPIRAIYGNADADVWFTRDDDSVDHFDGSTMTNHPANVPGLRITTVFGRADRPTFAVGHVAGEQLGIGIFPDKPYLFELSPTGIVTSNAPLAEKSGFVPVSGFVTNSVDPQRMVFLTGYQHRREEDFFGNLHEKFYFSHCLLGATTAAEIATPAAPGALEQRDYEDVPRPVLEMHFPGLNYKATDIRVPLQMWQIARWNGRELSFSSLAMGPDYQPAPILGAHASATESWIVGEGFAMKGANP